MTQMRVMAHNGMVLVYDTDDVEDTKVATPHDVIDVTRAEDAAVRRRLGQAHLELHIDFKPGKKAMWVENAEPMRLVSEKFFRDVAGANLIEELGLDARPYNALKGAGIRYVCDLLKHTEDELYGMRNMGVKSVANIKERLFAEFGLKLADA